MTRDQLIDRILARIEADGAIHRSSMEQEIIAWEAVNRHAELKPLIEFMVTPTTTALLARQSQDLADRRSARAAAFCWKPLKINCNKPPDSTKI